MYIKKGVDWYDFQISDCRFNKADAAIDPA